MDKLFSGFKRGLWLAIVFGIIFSVISWGWNLLYGVLAVFGVSKWIAIFLLPIILTAIGIISDSAFIPWLSARLQSAVTSSIMRRFSRNEGSSTDPDSWVGKEVVVALGDDCFCDGNVPNIVKFGVVSAIRVITGIDMLSVQLVYPPTGTGERMEIRQDSCQVRLTGNSIPEHAKMVSSLGRMCKDITMLSGRSNMCTRGKGAARNLPSVAPTGFFCQDVPGEQLTPEEVARLSSGSSFLKMNRF